MTREELRRALCLEPAHAAILNLMAMAEPAALALSMIERAITVDPVNPAARTNRGVILERLARLDGAIEAHGQAVAMAPALIQAWTNLGQCLILAGRAQEAAEALAHALSQDPGDAGPMVNFAIALGRIGRAGTSEIWARRATRAQPNSANAWNSLGLSLRDLGNPGEAFDAFRRALAHAPRVAELHSNLILTANYLAEGSIDERALLRDFAALHPQLPRPKPRAPDADRCLVVGYLSADFARHPVGYFLAGVIEHHESSAVRPILFASQTGRDARTERLAAAASAFIPVRDLDDAALAARIAAEGVDILVELSGHGAGNRLGVLARRPAPLQMCWGGLVGSTGLSAVDVLIADAREIPDARRSDYTERVAWLEPDYVCYAPPEDAPEVAAPPASTRGSFTFGCFNNLLKLNERVFDLWARILVDCATACLFLKGRNFDEPKVASRIRDAFMRRGVDGGRIEFEGPAGHRDLLDAYGRVDLALDPFPYCGGLTTLESLWMGVPVLTLPGRRFTARHGLAHLGALGLDDFVAADEAAYHSKALHWASSLPKLAILRGELRARMRASPLLDGAALARQVEAIYRREWRALLGL